MNRLKERIQRLVDNGSITDSNTKRRFEHLLINRKWNPYCFRHSAITDDSNHYPEYIVRKKARWTMDSKQANRYIKQTMVDDVKNKMLELHGIKIADKQTQEVYRTCSHCGYVNSLDNKYCEKSGCNSPLTQLAHDEIKAAEQAKLQEMVNKSNTEHEERITKMQHDLEFMKKDIQDVKEFKRIKSKNPRYGYEEFREEIDQELRRGKDLITALGEKLSNLDVIISRINSKNIPRIHKELLIH